MESEVRMGGKAVLRVFAQAEIDIGRFITDGSFSAAVAARHPSVSIEVVVDAAGRTDHLVQKLAGQPTPSPLLDMGFDQSFLDAQFSTGVTGTAVDVVVLSAASDLCATHWVHRSQGWIINPPPRWREEWPQRSRARLTDEFEERPLLAADDYTAAMREVIATIRQTSQAHIILLGASTLGEPVSLTYFGAEDDHRLRVHRVNVAQIRLSMALGVSVIDVDRIIANVGGLSVVKGPLEYDEVAITAICEELVHVIGDIGYFEERPLVAQVGQEWGR